MSAHREIAYRLDPALWVGEVVGVTPTSWQEQFLRAPRGAFIMALTARQVGKTTVATWAIAHAMLFYPGSLSVIACPAQRQSAEGVRRIREILGKTGGKFKSDNVYGLELDNGSRVLALPGDDETIRGLTVDAWIVADEAARLTEDLIAALHPMRARQPQARFAMLSTAWTRTDPFWMAWSSDNPNILRLKATADSDDAPFTKEFLEEQRSIMGEQKFKQEYFGIPGGGVNSPFTWDQYERATYLHRPLVPAGPGFPPPAPANPAGWPIKYPLIIHDVARTTDRSTAVVGGYCPLLPGDLAIKELVELPQNCFGHQLASQLARVDDRYNRDAVIVADLSNDASYAEVLFEVFGKRVIGVQIGAAGDGTEFERYMLKTGVMPVYRLGRTFLFDLLLQQFRSDQIRLQAEPMARRAFEQLNGLEVEQKENRVIYKCLPGQHDDLAISCALLAWAARHPHFMGIWARAIEDRRRPHAQYKPISAKAWV